MLTAAEYVIVRGMDADTSDRFYQEMQRYTGASVDVLNESFYGEDVLSMCYSYAIEDSIY